MSIVEIAIIPAIFLEPREGVLFYHNILWFSEIYSGFPPFPPAASPTANIFLHVSRLPRRTRQGRPSGGPDAGKRTRKRAARSTAPTGGGTNGILLSGGIATAASQPRNDRQNERRTPKTFPPGGRWQPKGLTDEGSPQPGYIDNGKGITERTGFPRRGGHRPPARGG